MKHLVVVVLVAAAAGCSDSPSSVSPEAQTAYLGIDDSIGRAIDSALFGVNTSMTENLDPRSVPGLKQGQVVVLGQVDQGTAAAKSLRVDTDYTGFSDDGTVIYDTNPASPPLLALELHSVPYGTLTGTFLGVFTLSGALTGTMTVNLTFDGQLQPAGNNVERVLYSTQVSGTAVSAYGSYVVDFTR